MRLVMNSSSLGEDDSDNDSPPFETGMAEAHTGLLSVVVLWGVSTTFGFLQCVVDRDFGENDATRSGSNAMINLTRNREKVLIAMLLAVFSHSNELVFIDLYWSPNV